MITVEEAHNRLFSITTHWGEEKVPLHQALGRFLATDMVADVDLPPFHRAMMDGLLVSKSVWLQGQREFRITHQQAAGSPNRPFGLNDAWEIMTGAAVPQLDLMIIPVEYLLEKDGWCIVRDPYQPPEHGHIHEKGLDRRAGATLLTSGTQLNAVHLGILASIGADPVCVYVQPKVAVIATGNELVPVQVTPMAHQIRMSNVHALSALLTEKFGIQSIPHFHLPDDPQAIQDWMDALSPSFDILLFSGGVSKGKKDYLPEIWSKNGFSCVFHGIAQKPGKPMWLGRRGDTVLFGFPGNPVSTLVCAYVYLLPWLRNQLGCIHDNHPVSLKLENGKSGTMTPLLPVNISGLTLEVLPYTSSGDFSGVSRMNGVVEYYPHQSRLWI